MRLHLIRSVAQQMIPGNCFSPEGAGPEERASPLSLAPCPCSASSDSHPTVEDVPSCHELHFRCRVDLLSWKQGCFDAPPFAPSYGNNTKGAMEVGESIKVTVCSPFEKPAGADTRRNANKHAEQMRTHHLHKFTGIMDARPGPCTTTSAKLNTPWRPESTPRAALAVEFLPYGASRRLLLAFAGPQRARF